VIVKKAFKSGFVK
jgi:hypothetical protein